MPHATIRDVAREAAVSVASVSRALNGHTNVRPSLRRHVQEVATRLGYVPHAGARSLSLSRSGVVGVVLPDLHGEFFSELLRGMDREASVRSMQLLLTVMHDDGGRGIDVLQTMRGSVDGLVVMAPHVEAAALAAHLPAGMPVVLVNCAPHDDRHAAMRAEVRIDNVAGAEAMIDHLVAAGRRRIVHLAGPADNIDAIERRRGVEIAAARAGVTVRMMAGDFHERAGIAAATALLPEIDTIDAIFAANDMMAIGVLMTLKRAGIAVPERVAVAGFDDIPLARLVSPSITTVRIDIAGFGARAVARLAGLVKGGGDGAPDPVAPMLVIRESTDQSSLNRGHSQGESTT